VRDSVRAALPHHDRQMTKLADIRRKTLLKIKIAGNTQAMIDTELRSSAPLWSTI
jgi:hypothetical protein